MSSLNDIVLRIHMTFLNNKDRVDWISSFEDEITPLSEDDFNNLVHVLEGVCQEEQVNFSDTIMNNQIPSHLLSRATDATKFYELIEQLKIEYARWKQ